jgi:hypothetical protein
MPNPRLNTTQRAKARRKLAAKTGVSENLVTDQMIYSAITAGTITEADCGLSSSSSSSSSDPSPSTCD